MRLAPEQPAQPPPRPFDLLTDVMDQVRLESTVYFRTVCNGAYGIRIAKRARTPFYALQEGEAEIRLDSGKIYHVPGSRDYDETLIDESKGEHWFCTEEEARANGWRAPKG